VGEGETRVSSRGRPKERKKVVQGGKGKNSPCMRGGLTIRSEQIVSGKGNVKKEVGEPYKRKYSRIALLDRQKKKKAMRGKRDPSGMSRERGGPLKRRGGIKRVEEGGRICPRVINGKKNAEMKEETNIFGYPFERKKR